MFFTSADGVGPPPPGDITALEGGDDAGAGGPPPTEVTGGPPIAGAPWARRRPIDQPGFVAQAPVAQGGAARAVPAVAGGPPIAGAPWQQRRAVAQATGSLSLAPAAPRYPAVPAVAGGPPIAGAPWQRFARDVQPPPPPARAAAPASAPAVPPVSGGPVHFAPWARPGPANPTAPVPVTPPPPPPPPGPAAQTQRLYLPRVPDTAGPHAEDRRRRHTEIIAAVFNGLARAGYIRQESQAEWALSGAGFVMDRPPTAADDVSAGVIATSLWLDTTAGNVYCCLNNASNSAVWELLSGGGGGGGSTGLTGTFP